MVDTSQSTRTAMQRGLHLCSCSISHEYSSRTGPKYTDRRRASSRLCVRAHVVEPDPRHRTPCDTDTNLTETHALKVQLPHTLVVQGKRIQLRVRGRARVGVREAEGCRCGPRLLRQHALSCKSAP